MTKSRKILTVLLSAIFALTLSAGLIFARPVSAAESYVLSFDASASAYDMASSAESWLRYNTPKVNDEGGVTLTLASGDATPKSYAAGVGKYTVEAGKTYVARMNIRTSANVYINFAIEAPWYTLFGTWAESKSWISESYSECSAEYTATASGDANLIFQLNAGAGDIYIKNFTFTEKIADKTVESGAAIGALPEIPEVKNFKGFWTIDGEKIDENTVYNYGANKTAKMVYERAGYGLSFQKEIDLAASKDGWWSQSGGINGMNFDLANAEITVDFPAAGGTVYCNAFRTTTGKEYSVAISCKKISGTGKFHYFRGDGWTLVKDWIPAGTDDYITNTYTFTAGSDGDVVIFQDAPSVSDSTIAFRNVIITDTVEQKTIEKGTAIGELPEIAEITGHEGFWTIDGEKITAETVFGYDTDKVAKIVYEAKKFVLTVNGSAREISYGSKIGELPAIPERAGYTGFWTVDGEEITSETTYLYTENKEAVVEYVPNDYTLTFGNLAVTVTYGEPIGTLPEIPAKEGYNGFWTIDGEEISADTIYEYTENKVAEIKYVEGVTRYEVTFTDENGKVIKSKRLAKGEAIGELPEVPVKEGYDGVWTIDGKPVTEETIFGYEENTAITVAYTAKKYTLTLGENEITVTYGEKIGKFPENTADKGYTVRYFIGDEEITEETVWNYAENKTAAAEKTLIEYTITFKIDGVTVSTQKYTVENKSYTLPELIEKEGYTAAWEKFELTYGDVVVNAVYTKVDDGKKDDDKKDDKGEEKSGCGAGISAEFAALPICLAAVFVGVRAFRKKKEN